VRNLKAARMVVAHHSLFIKYFFIKIICHELKI
jgi:hypothetical protein